MKASCPTKGSVMILNTSAQKGSSSAGLRCTVSLLSTLVAVIGGMSSGDGKYSTTASSSGWTPLFLKADPQTMGTSFNAMVERRKLARNSAGVISWPSTYFSSNESSAPQMASTI